MSDCQYCEMTTGGHALTCPLRREPGSYSPQVPEGYVLVPAAVSSPDSGRPLPPTVRAYLEKYVRKETVTR